MSKFLPPDFERWDQDRRNEWFATKMRAYREARKQARLRPNG
jgi:hypothetical protein